MAEHLGDASAAQAVDAARAGQTIDFRALCTRSREAIRDAHLTHFLSSCYPYPDLHRLAVGMYREPLWVNRDRTVTDVIACSTERLSTAETAVLRGMTAFLVPPDSRSCAALENLDRLCELFYAGRPGGARAARACRA
ncbi:hypothetical protein [Streptomyces sp. NBC_00096]|uniref:hypothetical protein n=1 Tax=Streptomyces sp. NBC_00096 TaxID=2975650 RepID=UPI003254BC31